MLSNRTERLIRLRLYLGYYYATNSRSRRISQELENPKTAKNSSDMDLETVVASYLPYQLSNRSKIGMPTKFSLQPLLSERDRA